jgi:esterase/lipase
MLGIEIGAERVAKETEDEIDRLKKNGITVTKISIVGYSLGGIVGRFTAGLLYHKGLFSKIKPMVSLENGH